MWWLNKEMRSRRAAEGALWRRLYDVLDQKDSESYKKFIDEKMSETECQAIFEVVKPIFKGAIATGAISLISLRARRSTWVRRFFQWDCRETAQDTSSFAQSYAFGWAGDITASTAMTYFALKGHFYYYNRYPPKDYADKMEAIPLLEGRSSWADYYCPIIMQEFKDIRGENDSINNDILDHPQTNVMKMYKTFERNCRLRNAYETMLRRRYGFSDGFPISIPHPGVPDDESLLKVHSNGGVDCNCSMKTSYATLMRGADNHLHESGDEDKDKLSSKEEWAMELVKDQEDR